MVTAISLILLVAAIFLPGRFKIGAGQKPKGNWRQDAQEWLRHEYFESHDETPAERTARLEGLRFWSGGE